MDVEEKVGLLVGFFGRNEKKDFWVDEKYHDVSHFVSRYPLLMDVYT